VAEPSGNPPGSLHVPFRPYCGGVITRTRNVSEYMLVLAACLVTEAKTCLFVCVVADSYKDEVY